MVEATKRPDVPTSHYDAAEHRRQLAVRTNASLTHDGSNAMSNPLLLASYGIDDLPSAALWTGAAVYVTDDIGGATIAFSNGTNWLRCSDLAAVSLT